MIIPGVQKPHCRPCFSQKPSWIGCRPPSGASPSIVVTSQPSACAANTVHALTASPLRRTVQAPHCERHCCPFTVTVISDFTVIDVSSSLAHHRQFLPSRVALHQTADQTRAGLLSLREARGLPIYFGRLRIQPALEASKKLVGQFVRCTLHQARPDTGNRPAHRHGRLPVHARLVLLQSGEVHLASHLHGTSRRFSPSLDDHALWFLHFWSCHIQGELGLDRSNTYCDDSFPLFFPQHFQALKTRCTCGHLIHIQKKCPDHCDGGGNRLRPRKFHMLLPLSLEACLGKGGNEQSLAHCFPIPPYPDAAHLHVELCMGHATDRVAGMVRSVP